MANHTSGPWRIYEMPADTVKGQASYRMTATIATPDMTVADVFNLDSPERRANAHLIAAAPDLLEACQRAEVECRNQLMRLEVSGDVNGMATRTYRELAAALLAAIDKATGRGQ